MLRTRKSAAALAVAAITALSATAARADLSGFSSFAPVNTNTTGPGYSADGSTFTVTTATNSEAVSGFAATPQDVADPFLVTFTYNASGGADGVSFLMQNDPRGTSALGASGGSFGLGGATAITPSYGAIFNIYNGGSYGNAANGSTATSGIGPRLNIDPVTVDLLYDGTNFYTSVREAATNANFTNTTAINLPTQLGGNTAYVGFTGGTGGANATQTVSNFTFKSNPSLASFYEPISVTGWTQNMLAGSGTVTATEDSGVGTGGEVFYQRGYSSAYPNTGLPGPGTKFLGTQDFNHFYEVGYGSTTNNNAVLLDQGNTSAVMTLTSPASYSALSFIAASGNGSVGYAVKVTHADGTVETFNSAGAVNAGDWFSGTTTIAVETAGRSNATGGSPDTVPTGGDDPNPRLYAYDVTLADTSSPVTSIELDYVSGSGHAGLYAISGVSTPEPASLSLLGLGGLALLARRRRKA